MTHYDQKNFYYDPLYDTLWPKKILLWSTMTHYDQNKFLLWSTVTHYDPKNLYYDPLYDTLWPK